VIDLAATDFGANSLGAMRSPHGLAFAAENCISPWKTNKAFGRTIPRHNAIDWVLGTGQDRTH
jgi:hypothetical protein